MSSSGGSQYFNPIPLFILFREAIEASIVVAVLLTFLSRASPSLKKHGEGCTLCTGAWRSPHRSHHAISRMEPRNALTPLMPVTPTLQCGGASLAVSASVSC